ncbi:Carboxylesterase family [Aspergillus sclerotialis]|uniref:Carboxylesterase family n=1 Tax=Aspergillus sclerotialis TaxID=2070753 RepID=A0A3A2ZSE9_9EURO|nr:Carboxylesterase family [Aspergillus sclerotialis]
MSFQTPTAKCRTFIPGLGTLDGLQYANGVQQFCGIPYAHLSKRWTRSTLKTSWKGDYHDGTQLGPIIEGDDADDLVPVAPAEHFNYPRAVDELSGLVMNIVIPHAFQANAKRLPVFVYVHGGSLLYGGANLPIFDAVNLVSRSISIGLPIVSVNFNYRVGIGGFLAGETIARELQRDGFTGSGNFGFTDQQVAFKWVQRFIEFLGGDAENVTAVGESAGGISISNQLVAADPPIFHRAVCMSGLSASIPAWTMKQHDHFFEAVCRHFKIDPAAENALDQLRAIPQQKLANATPIIQCVPSGTGNPCLDGCFYRTGVNPLEVNVSPPWLKALMIGDTYHEGVIFHLNLLEEDFYSARRVLQSHIQNEQQTDHILNAYGITTDLPRAEFLTRMEHMCGDAIFKIPNYLLAQECTRRDIPEEGLFLYHFDQRSRLPNAFEGTAYHAHELLYLFGNLNHKLNDDEQRLAQEFASAWIHFANGLKPWTGNTERKWMVWGPSSTMQLKNEDEDEEVRDYSRMNIMLELEEGHGWKEWLAGVDSLVNRRWKLVT